MAWKKEFRKIIQNEFDRHRQTDPRASMRSFAKKLEISIGGLSLMLAGKRMVKRSSALKILDKLVLPDADLRRVRYLMGVSDAVDRMKEIGPRPLAEVQAVLGDWRNFVLLPFLHCPNRGFDLPIKKATGLSDLEIQERMEGLRSIFPTKEELFNFLIDPLHDGKTVFTGLALQEFQQNAAEMLQYAVGKKGAEENSFFYHLGLPVSEERYRTLKSEINKILLNVILSEPEEDSSGLVLFSLQLIRYP